jgi:nickel-type superoxide dismutase maturation protease
MRKRLVLVSSIGAALTGLLAVARIGSGWFPVRVAGDSMSPVLSPGDWLAVRPLRASEPREGQIVVVRREGREMVKRVVRAMDAATFWVEGDNAAASTDSRTFGSVQRAEIAGVVRARYKPLRGARRFD